MAFARALGRPRRSGPAEGPGGGGSVSNPGPKGSGDERGGTSKAEPASASDAAARSGRGEAAKSGAGEGTKPGSLRRPGSGGSARSAGAQSPPGTVDTSVAKPGSKPGEGSAAAAAGGGQGPGGEGAPGRPLQPQPRPDLLANDQALAPEFLLQEARHAPATSLAGPCCRHKGANSASGAPC